MAGPYQTTAGYGVAGVQTTAGGAVAALVNTIDDMVVLYPVLNPAGAVSQFSIDPSTQPAGTNTPGLAAILIELRVITQLLLMSLNSPAPPNNIDVQQIRASEMFDINPTTGFL